MPVPDYIPYTPDEFAIDAPATALHFARWFENWLAGFGGALDAPRLWLPALERLAPGVEIRSRNDVADNTTGTVYIERLKCGFVQHGTVRVAWEYYRTGGNAQVQIIRRRAGSDTTVTSPTTSSGTYVAATADVAVIPGDTLIISYRQQNSATGSAYIRNVRIQTDGGDLWPAAVDCIVEGNRIAP